MLQDESEDFVETQRIILRSNDVLDGIVAYPLLLVGNKVFQVAILKLVGIRGTYYIVTVS